MITIQTPIGNSYMIDSEGRINQSSQWIMLGLVKTNGGGQLEIKFGDLTAEWLQSHSLRFKNGHPRYTICDMDHGTRRIWGNTVYHGVKTICFEEAK